VASEWGKQYFDHADFSYGKNGDYYLCPAGIRLEHAKSDLTANGLTYYKYAAKQRDCQACALRSRCITREKAILLGFYIFREIFMTIIKALFLGLIASTACFAITISGKVTDTSGIPIAGASVLLKQNGQIATSGIDGSFLLGNVATKDHFSQSKL